MADLENNFKLFYLTRRRLIGLLDEMNEFLLSKKLNSNNNINDEELKQKTDDLICKINNLELIENKQFKKRKLNQRNETYLDLNNNLRAKIIRILSDNKLFCLNENNLKSIINNNKQIENIIKNNVVLINELQNLNDYNLNSILNDQSLNLNNQFAFNSNNQFVSNSNNQFASNSNNQPTNLDIKPTNLGNQNQIANSINQNHSFNLNNQFSASTLINPSANSNNQFASNSINQPTNLNQTANLNNQSANLEMNENMKLEVYEPLFESNSISDDEDIIEIIEDSEFSDRLNKNTQSYDLPTGDQNFESDNNELLETIINNQTELNNENQTTESNNENQTTESNNENQTTESNNENQTLESIEAIRSNNQSNELIIINPEDFGNIDVHWFNTNKLIDLKNTKISWDNNYLTKLISQYSNLKYFKINILIDAENFDLNVLNQFKKLEQLDIYFISQLKNDINLNLNELKILQIEHDHRITEKIKINSSKLNYFYCNCLRIMNIINKTPIEIIDTQFIDKSIYEFPNLKIINLSLGYSDKSDLSLEDFNNGLESIKELQISKLVNLKRINYNVINNNPNVHFLNNLINDVIELFRKWFSKKINNLKFYRSNFEIDNLDHLKLISKKIFSKNQDEMMSLYFDNLNKIEPELNYLSEINYNNLINNLNYQQFTNLFFQKLNNIRIIKTKKINNPDEFLKFLKKLDKLSHIDFYQPHLNQEFYLEFSKLKHLIIDFSLIETRIKLNYDFLLNFKLLNSLNLTGNLESFDFFIDLMTKLDILTDIKLNHDEKEFKLMKHQVDSYELTMKSDSNSNTKTRNKKLNKLINKKIKLNKLKELCCSLEKEFKVFK